MKSVTQFSKLNVPLVDTTAATKWLFHKQVVKAVFKLQVQQAGFRSAGLEAAAVI